MKVAILAPGPSLANFPGDPDAILVGVNRAAAAYFCHWIAAIDYTFLEKYGDSILSHPRLLTNQNTADHFARTGGTWASREHVTTDWLRRSFCDTRAFPWTLYSFTSALVFAAYMGAERVDIWGADFAGTLDWDGVPAGETRDARRWSGERALYENVKGWMESKGITVTRHVSDR